MKTMKQQILFACLTAFVLLILSGALLIRLSVSASAKREAKYGEAILDIDRDDLQLNNESFFFPGVKDAAELGITRESIDARRPTVDIKGTRYQCTYGNSGPSSVLIYLHPYDQLVGQSTGEALLVSAVMLLLLVSPAGERRHASAAGGDRLLSHFGYGLCLQSRSFCSQACCTGTGKEYSPHSSEAPWRTPWIVHRAFRPPTKDSIRRDRFPGTGTLSS